MDTDYYSVKDVMAITNSGKSWSYEVISKLLNKFRTEYPNAITREGRIPKWYFEENLMNKKPQKSTNSTQNQT